MTDLYNFSILKTVLFGRVVAHRNPKITSRPHVENALQAPDLGKHERVSGSGIQQDQHGGVRRFDPKPLTPDPAEP
jgi:hypothetical protein